MEKSSFTRFSLAFHDTLVYRFFIIRRDLYLVKIKKDGSPSLKGLNILAWGFVIDGASNLLVRCNQFEDKKTKTKPKCEMEIDEVIRYLNHLFPEGSTQIFQKIAYIMR